MSLGSYSDLLAEGLLPTLKPLEFSNSVVLAMAGNQNSIRSSSKLSKIQLVPNVFPASGISGRSSLSFLVHNFQSRLMELSMDNGLDELGLSTMYSVKSTPLVEARPFLIDDQSIGVFGDLRPSFIMDDIAEDVASHGVESLEVIMMLRVLRTIVSQQFVYEYNIYC